jgi:hypothetical protein
LNKAEKKFAEWLDEREIAYWYVEQERKTKSKRLRSEDVKRPDFVVFVDNVGLILVDVKGYGPYAKADNFNVNSGEVVRYVRFGNKFKLSVWFVFSFEEVRFKTWYWIPVEDVMDCDLVVRSDEDSSFYAVPMDLFCQLGVDDGIGELFE